MKNNPVWFIAVGLVVLGGLFILLKPQQQSQNTTQVTSSLNQTISSPTPDSNIKKFDLVINGKKLVSGEETIKVNQGDEVVIKVTSDENDEFHIHGYDKFADLKPNQPAEIKFIANLTGRFIFEMENSKTDIGALEVQPK